MKNGILILFTLMGFAYTVACNQHEDSKDIAEDENKDKFISKDGKKDAQLMVDLVSTQYYEIHLSRAALARSKQEEVRSLAASLVVDHSALLSNLRTLAGRKVISVPDEDSTEVNKKLAVWKNKTAGDFDKAWVEEMIEKHQSALDNIQNAVDRTDIDEDIKAMLMTALPTIRIHLDKLKEIKGHL